MDEPGKAAVVEAVEGRRERLAALAREIWERPEPAFEETHAAARIAGVLRERGFDVEVGAGGLDTAVVARYGGGSGPDPDPDPEPVVATMGEYDALPGLSQRAAAERDPVEPGAAGHGCGHNLFGVGSLGGALAVADAVDAGLDGEVRYVGTPAEEAGAGKQYLVRAGVFDDVDAVVSWHPGWYNAPSKGSCLALDSFTVRARGESSHAAAAPEAGRSALDGIQLLNTALEYTREHVPESARLHYVIEEGGDAANVVPPAATASYILRAPERSTVEGISDWFRDAARGAALMADVEVDVTQTAGIHGVRPNGTLGDAIRANMAFLGGFEIEGREERDLAAGLRESLGDVSDQLADLPERARADAQEAAYYTEPLDAPDAGETGAYSTDSGDVSQVVPLGRFTAATWPVGTPPHSWQAVAASGSTGREGMLYAAKVIGTTLYDLLADPGTLAAAREEFEATGGRDGYEPGMPGDADPYALLGVERPGVPDVPGVPADD